MALFLSLFNTRFIADSRETPGMERPEINYSHRDPITQITCVLDLILLGSATVVFFLWIGDVPPFYSSTRPVLSPFTCFSLMLLSGSRIALQHLKSFPSPLSLALLLLVIGGNISSVMVQSIEPELLKSAFPHLVGTSVSTSFGLIMFACYEALIIVIAKNN